MTQIEKNGWPFDSKGTGYTEEGFPQGDRDGGSEDLADFFSSYTSNGIIVFRGFDAEADSLKCAIVSDSLSVRINIGRINIWGRVRRVSEPYLLEFPRDAQSKEYKIIMRLDLDDAARNIAPTYTDGSLLRTDKAYDMQLAILQTVGGAYTLDGATLTDTRGDSTVCGYSSFLGQPAFGPNIDGGYFTDDEMSDILLSHASNPLVHPNMIADGLTQEVYDGGIVGLAEHEVDENAHPNIILDGNQSDGEEL